MSGVILKFVRNGRMFITCCIDHTDLALDKKIRVFKRGVNRTVKRVILRVELVERFHGGLPVGKAIIIAHE